MNVHEPTNLSAFGNVISTIIVAVALGIGGVMSYFRERKEPKTGQDLVLASATFSDRATIEHLVRSLDKLCISVERMTVLLEEEAQVRHDANIREQTIRDMIHKQDLDRNK